MSEYFTWIKAKYILRICFCNRLEASDASCMSSTQSWYMTGSNRRMASFSLSRSSGLLYLKIPEILKDTVSLKWQHLSSHSFTSGSCYIMLIAQGHNVFISIRNVTTMCKKVYIVKLIFLIGHKGVMSF